jgi:splicing factor 3B subunit 2
MRLVKHTHSTLQRQESTRGSCRTEYNTFPKNAQVSHASSAEGESAAASSDKPSASAAASAETEKDEDDDAGAEATEKEKRRKARMDVSVLKRLVAFPEVVEMHDGNSTEPLLLCHLKSYRNTVPVPRHWSQKRRYLQNRRGFLKPPFQLPQFIMDTGISEIRNTTSEADAGKNLKAKSRERTQPKIHRLDIDYQVLHDAFFKHQVKPNMSSFGDVYHEGKELDAKLRLKRPGRLSEELRKALGLQSATAPPPWLINMQRYGPPPAYANMHVPGLNCPIPAGARFGYGEGEWGKPPVDEAGVPIYGDPFGVYAAQEEITNAELRVDKGKWGVLVAGAEGEDDDDEEEEDEDDDADEADEDEDDESAAADGSVSVSGLSSVASAAGLQTPDEIEMRKRSGLETPSEQAPMQMRKELYTVLEQKEARVGGALYGSAYTYAVPGGAAGAAAASGAGAPAAAASGGGKGDQRPDFVKSQLAAAAAVDAGVSIALAPEELENLDAAGLKQKYQEQLELSKAARTSGREDYSDILEEESAKKKRKNDGQKGPKTKQFKF